MISDSRTIEIFYNIDDITKEFNAVLTKNSVSEIFMKRQRVRSSKMNKSEVMTINNYFLMLNHIKNHLVTERKFTTNRTNS